MAQRLSRRMLASYIADELMQGADRKKLVRQIAAYLVETRRTNEAPLLVRDIEDALSDRGHVLARVTTARPLSGQLKQELTQMIKGNQAAETVEIVTDTDPSLLGGVRVETPGFEYDNTLHRRLLALKSKTLEKQL